MGPSFSAASSWVWALCLLGLSVVSEAVLAPGRYSDRGYLVHEVRSLMSSFRVEQMRLVDASGVRTFEFAVFDMHLDQPLYLSSGKNRSDISFADLWLGNLSTPVLDGVVQVRCKTDSFDRRYVASGPPDSVGNTDEWDWSDVLIPFTQFRSTPALSNLTHLDFANLNHAVHVDVNRFSALLLLAEWDVAGTLLYESMPVQALSTCEIELLNTEAGHFISSFQGQPIDFRGTFEPANPPCASSTVMTVDGDDLALAQSKIATIEPRFCQEEALFNQSFLEAAVHVTETMKIAPLLWLPVGKSTVAPSSSMLKGCLEHMIGLQVGPAMVEETAVEVAWAAATDLTNVVAANVSMLLPDALTQALSEGLAQHLLDYTVDSVASTIWEPLVADIVTPLKFGLVRTIPKVIDKTFPKLMARSLSVSLTNLLTRSVTHSVTSTLSQALYQDKDHMAHCHSCFYHNVGCNYCKFSVEGSYYSIYASDYYSDWYGDYYADYYTHALDNVIVTSIKQDRDRVNKENPGSSRVRLPETEHGEWGGGYAAEV